jgi:2-polyprenyl-3-methyl-5-hydroxy-6-metoxy-1,4-benzoquinol methylase
MECWRRDVASKVEFPQSSSTVGYLFSLLYLRIKSSSVDGHRWASYSSYSLIPRPAKLNDQTETCQICFTPGAYVEMSLPRFDLLRCTTCTHLFSRLKVAAEMYGAEYFLESNLEHWENPEIDLFDQLHEMVQKFFPGDVAGLRSLDVGAAIGYLPRRFGELGYESWGIDISKEAVRYGTEQLKIPRLLATLVEDFNPEKPFPVITSLYVIEHVSDPIVFLNNIHRILSDDGIFICMTVDSNSLFFRLAKALFQASGGRSYASIERICEVHHLHHFNGPSLDRALSQTGFEVIHRFNRNLPFRTLTLSPAQKLAVGTVYGLSTLLDSRFLQGVVCRRTRSK